QAPGTRRYHQWRDFLYRINSLYSFGKIYCYLFKSYTISNLLKIMQDLLWTN
ncbi:hypothetical protein COCVIDRAFT_104720, partial [Bipolaris victoriae FI3]